jgi:hypothetical protein
MKLQIIRNAAIRSVLLGSVLAVSCGGSDTVGPDALRPEIFELALMDNQTLPALAYVIPMGFGAQVYLLSARIVSVQPGRTTDPRIFDDRSGNGANGGNSRDSTLASAKMADVRVFQERTAAGAIVATRADSTGVTVERRGDVVLIRRDHPDPTRVVVDTGQFIDGKLIMRVREWERFNPTSRPVLFQYVITKSTLE